MSKIVAIKNVFDESNNSETVESDSTSPPIRQNESDINTSILRQPLASSSRRSLENTARKSPQMSKQKNKPEYVEQRRANTRSLTQTPQLLQGGSSDQLTTRSAQTKPRAAKKISFSEQERENVPTRNIPPISTASTSRRKKKPRKLVPKEIKKYQHSTGHLVPKLPFSRVIRECLMKYGSEDLRITPTALEALQEAAEIYLTIFFEDAYRCTTHRGRITLIVKDMELVRVLRGVNDPGYFDFGNT